MNIFLTNDDGYQSKGIHVLAKILSDLAGPRGKVEVIAPKKHQSGTGMGLSLGPSPVAYKELGQEGNISWAYLDATPASCVKFVLNYGKCTHPHIVVSGANHGHNTSAAALYSGTLGAAAEGTLNGIPSFGVSLASLDKDADFSCVEKYLPGILQKLIDNPTHRAGIYYNINFPDLPADKVKGIRIGVMGQGRWIEEYSTIEMAIKIGRVPECMAQTPKEEGESLFVMLGDYLDNPFPPQRADNHLIDAGYISIVAHSLYNTDNDETLRLLSMPLECEFDHK